MMKKTIFLPCAFVLLFFGLSTVSYAGHSSSGNEPGHTQQSGTPVSFAPGTLWGDCLIGGLLLLNLAFSRN